MRSMQSKWLPGLCLAATIFIASCNIYNRVPAVGKGPPAHAQAHGYRHKQACGYDLLFDSSCGVYVVVGMSDCYYHDGYFYRLHGDVWQISVRVDGDWCPVDHHALPPGLYAKTKVKAKPKMAVATQADRKPQGKAKGIGKIK